MADKINLPIRLGSLLAIVVLTLLVYLNHFHNPFAFDDDHTIVTNEYIKDIHNIPLFFKDARTTSSLPKSQAYRPGLTTLNAIDYWWGGKPEADPFYFHISIFIGFVLSGILLIFITQKILTRWFSASLSWWMACFTGLWFLLHTSNAQTINYIIARSDSFSTFMVIVAFAIYLLWPSLRKTYLYMIPVIIGFFVKEPTIMFVPILAVYKLLFENDNHAPLSRHQILKVAKQTAIPFAIVIGQFLFSRAMTPAVWTSGNTDRWSYLLSQPYVFIHYFNNFFVPVNLVVDTDWQIISNYLDDKVFIGLGFLSILLFIVYKTYRKAPPVAFGILWFLLALLPSSSIFPLAEVLNDHRPYFPYIGLFIASAYALAWIIKKWQTSARRNYIALLLSVLIITLALNAYGTYQRNIIWSSTENLWKDAIEKAPLNGRAWMNYGNTQLNKMNYSEAERCYNMAKRWWPDYPYLYINIGVLKQWQGKPQEAEENFLYAQHLDSLNPECYHFYAEFLFSQNRMQECYKTIETGLILSPKHVALLNLKQKTQPYVTAGISPLQDKINQALLNVQQNPTPENYLQLSLEYYNNKQFTECIDACNQAILLKPDYDLAYNNICSAYNQLGEWDKAIEAGEKGLKINPSSTLIKGNLDYAYQQKNQSK